MTMLHHGATSGYTGSMTETGYHEEAMELTELTGTLTKAYYPKKGKEGWVFASALGHKVRKSGPQVCIIDLDDGRKVWGIRPMGVPYNEQGNHDGVRFSIIVEGIDWNAAGDFGFYVVREDVNHFNAKEVQ